MRQQIGWYDPGSHRFCYTDVKETGGHDSYVVPVYADDESDEVQSQVLENQCALLLAAVNTVRYFPGWERIQENLVKTRRRTVELLEKARK